ncbi:hypothetical protein [uncultured Brachyspira sp.]|uniref:hypothetical protein n=1 Tax=uncultured Brachyspira sp. TaxID=221953 RepID=UPI0025E2CFFF|nr:hypothetical protein [uncultured Brachyspira sp.]
MSKYENIKVLSVSHLDFKAVGKLVLKNTESWNIPHLHFMVNKADDGIFEAVCLELMLFNSGEDIKSSITNLVTNILEYFDNNINSAQDLDKYIICVDTNAMDNYWRHYRKIDGELAKFGKDINNTLEKQIIEEVKEKYKNTFNDFLKKYVDIQNKLNQVNATIEPKYKIDEIDLKEVQ